MKLSRLLLCSFLLPWSPSVYAQDKAISSPLELGTNLGQVITVAKEGGDFLNPISAIKSITDASKTKPYIVYMAPGVYKLKETLRIKPYVSLVGSGRHVTIISPKKGWEDTCVNSNRLGKAIIALDDRAIGISNLSIQSSHRESAVGVCVNRGDDSHTMDGKNDRSIHHNNQNHPLTEKHG